MTQTPHGTEPRGLKHTPRHRSYEGRFGRLFQDLAKEPAHDPTSEADVAELRGIAAAMRENAGDGADNSRIPAGYVYLGQFVDHDITFDPTSQLSRRNDPETLPFKWDVEKAFEALTKGATRISPWRNYRGDVFRRDDGIEVGIRYRPKAGEPTVDIKFPPEMKIKQWKIHVQ